MIRLWKCTLSVLLIAYIQCTAAANEPVAVDEKVSVEDAQTRPIVTTAEGTQVPLPENFLGLNLGVGLALSYPFDNKSEILEAVVDANGYVRIAKEVKRQPRIVLESHYFFATPSGENLPWLFKWINFLGCGNTNICGHGPFVAIEPGGDNEPIEAYSLGYMLGFKRSNNELESASWNIGIGYVADPSVQYLGEGLIANQLIPPNDAIRYREESRAGFMIVTSFAF